MLVGLEPSGALGPANGDRGQFSLARSVGGSRRSASTARWVVKQPQANQPEPVEQPTEPLQQTTCPSSGLSWCLSAAQAAIEALKGVFLLSTSFLGISVGAEVHQQVRRVPTFKGIIFACSLRQVAAEPVEVRPCS